MGVLTLNGTAGDISIVVGHDVVWEYTIAAGVGTAHMDGLNGSFAVVYVKEFTGLTDPVDVTDTFTPDAVGTYYMSFYSLPPGGGATVDSMTYTVTVTAPPNPPNQEAKPASSIVKTRKVQVYELPYEISGGMVPRRS